MDTSKRQRLDVSCIDGDAGSDLRSVVAEIYASYSRLSSSRVEEPRSGSDTEFHRLLDLTSRHQSNSSINRLAMRLLPRLVHKSPTHSEPVIRMLMQTLSSNGISGDEAIACAARNDAMQGLQTIMDVAISHLPPSEAGRLALHVSRFVISLLAPQPTLSSKRSLESTLPLPSPDPEAIVASCFTSFPRAVLSLCLSSFLDPPSSVMGQGSLIALNRVILAKPPPSLNLPSKKESNSSESLAALILDRLPETRAWLRQQIVDICKAPVMQMASREVRIVLEKLMSLVLPPPPLLPPPPPPSRPPSEPSTPPSTTSPLFIGRGGPVCVASPTLFISSLSPTADEAQIRKECLTASANITHVQLPTLNSPQSMGISPYGLKAGEAYASFASITDAALFYDSCSLSKTLGEGQGLVIEFCPLALHNIISEEEGSFIWVLNRPPLTSPSSLLTLINDLGLPSPHQVIQVSGQAPGHLIQYVEQASQSTSAIAHSLAYHLLPPSLLATVKQHQQHVVLMHRKWLEVQARLALVRAAQPPPLPPPAAPAAPPSEPERSGSPPADSVPVDTEMAPPLPSAPQWSGQLCKSGIFVCNLICSRDAFSASTAALNPSNSLIQSGCTAVEPDSWSQSLDVKQRGPPSYAVEQYIASPSHMRALKWLEVPQDVENEAGHKRLKDFMQQLLDKDRAGVIKWEQDANHHPRTLFLIPPTRDLCISLGAEWPPLNPISLLAVIVPQISNATQR